MNGYARRCGRSIFVDSGAKPLSSTTKIPSNRKGFFLCGKPSIHICNLITACLEWASPARILPIHRSHSMKGLNIRVECTNAIEYPADVLGLKYAQGLYGLDANIVSRLASAGHNEFDQNPPANGESVLLPTH